MRQALGRKVHIVESAPSSDAAPSPLVPRQRVAAVVHVASGSALAGDLYAAIDGPHATSEPILERLNDGSERYLPLAFGDRHYLLNKTSVVFVELRHVENAGEYEAEDGGAAFHVEILLDSGAKVRGVVHSHTRRGHYRTLDHLNESVRGFLRVVRPSGVVYVNHDHVVAAYDVLED